MKPDDVPPGLRGPGVIVRRQTTYWELRQTSGELWRLHFIEKREVRFVDPRFERVEVSTSNPMLRQYHQPWAQLYYTGALLDREGLLQEVASIVRAASEGWRTIDDYLNRGADLDKAYGLLLSAPVEIVRDCSAALENRGLATSQMAGAAVQGSLAAAVLGPNVVVASRFRFEPGGV